ncbi:hypothetical protein OCGS_0578 [Oceaniovalibus guishaninsula JLT2003]|uniref:Lipoprotein n=1 Tax=Oceaniovalibus guishaninsula JLT2003 TaxID=1231392 RepID=K2HDF3_9RHOB|nr:hypothetical protein [Oceaniovalibus guishaninsula]EKE45488.1 hypothetical protein OCGS_0578 [Oceaniovalibus guishaninsula JLT2003]
MRALILTTLLALAACASAPPDLSNTSKQPNLAAAIAHPTDGFSHSDKY